MMNKQKLLGHLIDELNTMELVSEKENYCEVAIRFQNKELTHQERGVMKIHKYVNDSSGYVCWAEYRKELTKFERLLLLGVVRANHHRILYF